MGVHATLPCSAGIGLRAVHYREVLDSLPGLGWVEVHSENFFGGGAPLRTPLKVRKHYPVSLHGVGMGLASCAPLDPVHLGALHSLCERVQPAVVSEHLCWNSASGTAAWSTPTTIRCMPMFGSCMSRLRDTSGRALR